MSYSEIDPEYKQVKFLEKCGHRFCEFCFVESFRSLIEDQNKSDKLRCPQFGCDVKPTKDEVKFIIDNSVFDKFIKFTNNKTVAQNKNLIFCSTADCEETLEVKSKKYVLC